MSNHPGMEMSPPSRHGTFVTPRSLPTVREQNLNSMEDNNSTGCSNCTKISKREWITLFVLCFVHLIYNLESFAFSGVLNEVTVGLDLSMNQLALPPAVFSLSYFAFTPVFGYTGDRYSRRAIMALGVGLWTMATLAASFLVNSFNWFVFFRAMSGVGQATFSVIAPSIISDIFTGDLRSKMLAVFYFSFSISSLLGYLIGAQVATWMAAWYWSLRWASFWGVITVVLILFYTIEPPRGQREFSKTLKPTPWRIDIGYLVKNGTFILTTLGYTCVTFVSAALRSWAPRYISYGLQLLKKGEKTSHSTVSLYVGIIVFLSAIIGVPLGAVASIKLRRRNPRGDPLICGVGVLVSIPFIFGGILLASTSEVVCYTLLLLGEICLKTNYSIVADMLLYVVIPTRRCTAQVIQILVSVALGASGSPYLIGQLASWIKGFWMHTDDKTNLKTWGVSDYQYSVSLDDYQSLQYALLTNVIILVLGGVCFLVATRYISEDKKECQDIVSAS